MIDGFEAKKSKRGGAVQPEHNMTLHITGRCYEHRYDAVKFSCVSWTSATATVQKWGVSAVVNDRNRPASSLRYKLN